MSWFTSSAISIIVHEPHNCVVICKCYNDISLVFCNAVVNEQNVKHWTQYTPLWCTSAQCDGFRDSDNLRSVAEVKYPVAHVFSPCADSFSNNVCEMSVLNAELKPMNSIRS